MANAAKSLTPLELLLAQVVADRIVREFRADPNWRAANSDPERETSNESIIEEKN